MVGPEWHLDGPRVRPSRRDSRSRANVGSEVLPLLSGMLSVRKRGVSILAYAISEGLERTARTEAGTPRGGKNDREFVREVCRECSVNFR